MADSRDSIISPNYNTVGNQIEFTNQTIGPDHSIAIMVTIKKDTSICVTKFMFNLPLKFMCYLSVTVILIDSIIFRLIYKIKQ